MAHSITWSKPACIQRVDFASLLTLYAPDDATDEVLVKRASGGVLLPKKITLEQLESILGAFRGRFVRRQPRMQKRRWRRSGSSTRRKSATVSRART